MPVRFRRSLKPAVVTIVAAATLISLAACGTSSSSGGGPSKEPDVTLTVGVVPVADIAPLYLGIQHHFFASRGLKIVPKQVQQGSLIINQVISGALDIGFSNNVSLIAAVSHGLPLHIVAAGNQAGPGLYSAIFVRAGGPIRTPQDLAGKHIAVNAVANVGPLVVNSALQKEGVDVSKISYVAVPFPNMANALVKGFTAAMNESLRYAQSHPAQVRQILPTFLKIPTAVATKVVLPEWGTNVESAQLATTAQLARRYGYISTVPDITELTGG